MLEKIFIFIFLFSISNERLRLDFTDPNIDSKQNFNYLINNVLSNPTKSYLFQRVEIYNFNSFKDIDFSFLNRTKSIGTLSFKCRDYLILDNNLQFNFLPRFENTIFFKFAHLKAIASNLNTFDHLFDKKYLISILFFYSHLFFKYEDATNAIARNFYEITFFFNCKYYLNTDPRFFWNKNVDLFRMFGLSDTFIKKNVLSFNQMEIDLKSNVINVEMKFYKYNIDYRLIDKPFENTQFIHFSGRISSISENVFYNLTKIKKIEISTNIYGLVNGLNFLNSLNSNITTLLNKSNDYTIYFKINRYNYPDEDFCLFNKFPENKFILIKNLDENLIYSLECTCLYIWLLKLYYFKKGHQLAIEQCSNFDQLSCDFNFLTRQCDKKDYSNKKIYFDDTDILFFSEKVNFIIFILTPILCIFSFLSNIINMVILSKFCLKEKNLKIERKKMHILMFISSMLNSTYSFIYIFHLFNICIFENLDLCPIISRSFGVQFFEIYLIDFFANILKTISNFVAVLVSWQRLSLLKNKNLSKINFKWKKIKKIFFYLLLLFSILCNCEKILTSEIKIDLFKDYYYAEFPSRNTFKGIFDQENRPMLKRSLNFKQEKPMYFALFLLNFVLNDVLIVLIFCIIDTLMIVKYRKDILKRKQILSRIQKMERIVQTDQNLMRILTIIALNNSILIITRGIEFLFNFLIFYFFVFDPVCSRLNKICTNFYHIGNIFFFISSWFTFILYVCINKDFKIGLNLFLKYFKLNLNLS